MSVQLANRLGKLGLIDERKRVAALSLVGSAGMYDLSRVSDEHCPSSREP